ncbi:MAG: hypothetical protein AB8B87_14280 [Granulosicoccus sp.]
MQTTGLLLVAAKARIQWRQTSRLRTLHHHGGPDDINNHWTLEGEGIASVNGTLIHSGYRSAGLLVLAIQVTDDTKVERIPIWRDSVSAIDFSYLNLQLLFNACQSSSAKTNSAPR